MTTIPLTADEEQSRRIVANRCILQARYYTERARLAGRQSRYAGDAGAPQEAINYERMAAACLSVAREHGYDDDPAQGYDDDPAHTEPEFPCTLPPSPPLPTHDRPF